MISKGSVFSCFAAVAAFMLVSSVSILIPDSAYAGNSKVEICHIPPGNPDNYHTIKIGEKALSAHFDNHGDLGGPCDANCAALCDDGDACTVDDNGACEGLGCPVPTPVDCSDGNLCTIDSCDSVDGCSNEPVVCDEGFSCNPGNGACEPDVPPPAECPCFDLDTLMTELAVNGGALAACGDYDGSVFPNVSDGKFVLYNNFSLACSGDGGTNCTAIVPKGCGFATGWNGTGWDSVFTSPVTDDEDTECRALLQQICDSVGAAPAQASDASASSSSDVPSVIQ